MEDYQLAHLMRGKSYYDDDVRRILFKRHQLEHLDLLDCFILADCFVRAGADIRNRIEDNEVHVAIFVDPEDRVGFMKRLGDLISENYGSLGQGKR